MLSILRKKPKMRKVHPLLVFLDPLALVALCDVIDIASK